MLSFLSTLSRSIRACRSSSVAPPIAWLVRSSYYSTSHQDAQAQDAAHQQALADKAAAAKAANAAKARLRWATDPEFRQAKLQLNKKWKRDAATRWKALEYYCEYDNGRRELIRQRDRKRIREDLAWRRSQSLHNMITCGKRRHKEGWTWKTHSPIYYPGPVERHCTSCDKDRYIKLWWKEHNADRYMCNRCFANDWDLVIPEGYVGKPPLLFTSPNHPPPPKHEYATEGGDKVKEEQKEMDEEKKTQA